ncbi:epidermal growth factor receptor substrate 15-like 1 isoform X3 [Lineus longissimus]|uniref:epidermal growth factor receptor substrate 15-like 1 isoform X3 n=1 Tax=Lineus longissimus TaxID=88925 RepID=UPI00315DA5B0
MKDSTMSMPEPQEEESSPSQNMQMELHSKGAVLTKAWSDLFSFISKYQAELTVKENAVEIAEREIDVRKRQLDEMKPMVDAGNEEVEKLQEEIRTKERLLSKSQSELCVKEQMLRSVQSDLTCNMELLEKARCDLLDRQSELVRNRGDLERLKSELTIKQEQIQIKDNLLRKLQNQLMKENAELKEQLELNERTLEMERRSHEMTKRTLREKSKPSASAVQSVIEIPDSPPTLDLSVEQEDYGLSNIISAAEAQRKRPYTMDQDLPTKRFHSSTQDSALSRLSAMTSESFTDFSRSSQPMTSGTTSTKLQWSMPSPTATSPRQVSQSRTPTQMPSSPSFQEPSAQSDSFNVAATSASDTFFPLSVSQSEEDSKAGIDGSAGAMYYSDAEMQGSGQYMPGTPGSSGTSDSNQGGPVPVSGPIPTGGISPGGGMSPGGSTQEGADGKELHVDGCIGKRTVMKRKTQTYQEKYDIINFAKEHPGMKQVAIAAHFNLKTSTLNDILRKKDRIVTHIENPDKVGRPGGTVKSVRMITYADVDITLINWFRVDVLPAGKTIDSETLRRKAEYFARKFNHKEPRISSSWIDRFMKRWGIGKELKSDAAGQLDTLNDGTPVNLSRLSTLNTGMLNVQLKKAFRRFECTIDF